MIKRLVCLLLLLSISYSCEEILLEDDISNETVKLIAPSNDAQFFSTGITFTWEPIENGTSYRIQIAKPDFENPIQIIADNVTDTTSFTTQLNVGKYQWRVQAVNSGYQTAHTTRSFTIVSNEDFQSNSITLSSPINNLITNVADQKLVWQPVIGAEKYRLQIIDVNNNTLAFEEDILNTSYSYTFAEGSYQWKIRATNGAQNTLYASRNILVDITAPNTPKLTLPADLTNTSDNDVTFQWTRATIAGSLETDTIYIYSNKELTNLIYSNVETSPYNTASLNDGTYFWFIKSTDAAGNVSQQSSVFSFTLN